MAAKLSDVSHEKVKEGGHSYRALCKYIGFGGGPLWVCAVLVLGLRPTVLRLHRHLACMVGVDETASLLGYTVQLNTTSVEERVNVYVGLAFAQVFGVLFLSIASAFATNIAGRRIHRKIVSNILHAPSGWFEATPSGQIISRLSGDLAMMDKMFGFMVDNCINLSFQIGALVVVMCIIIPPMTPVLLSGSCYTKWLSRLSTSQPRGKDTRWPPSPVMTTIGETVNGRALIHAMGLEDYYFDKQSRNVDTWNRYNHFSATALA